MQSGPKTKIQPTNSGTWLYYLWMHYYSRSPIRRWNSGKSFSSDIPLWVELSNYKCFFEYFKDKFESEDVMLIWDSFNEPSNLNKIEEFLYRSKMEMHCLEKCKRFWSLCHHPVWLWWLWLWILYKSQNPIGHCHNWLESKGTFFNSKIVLLSKLISSLF